MFTYDNFMDALGRFPNFCNEAKDSTDESDLENACKIELAAILAHMKTSSIDLVHNANISCSGPDNGQP